MMVGKAIDDVIRTIVGYYGADAQSMQTCEECAELIQAVSKLSRSDTNTKFVERIKNLTEEIADVRIMTAQLMYIYAIPDEAVMEVVDQKLRRQLERISMPGTDLSSAQYLAKKEADRLLARLGGKE